MFKRIIKLEGNNEIIHNVYPKVLKILMYKKLKINKMDPRIKSQI